MVAELPLSPTLSEDTNDVPSMDLLDPKTPNSTNLLDARYDKYLQLITIIQRFADGYLKMASANVKMNDQLSKSTLGKDLPNFEASPEGMSAVSGSAVANKTASAVESDAASPTFSSEVSVPEEDIDINVFVYSLRRNITALYNSSIALERQIEDEILPPVKKLYSEVDSRKKDFISESGKFEKEVSHSRANSSKDIKKLGESILGFNSERSKIDYKRDPYIIKRGLMKDAISQVQIENEYIDFLENNERAMKVLEAQIMAILKDSFSKITSAACAYYGKKTNAFQNISNVLNAVPIDKEWYNFAAKNSKYLTISRSTDSADAELTQSLGVASLDSLVKAGSSQHSNTLKRNYQDVEFTGKNDPSTSPTLEGNLSKREGTLKKKYSSYYFVITRSKFLLELPTESLDTASPSLVLYLPECLLLNIKQDGKFRFSLKGKDVSNILKVRKKTYTFKASSNDEFLTWYNVISEMTGLMSLQEESRRSPDSGSPDETDNDTTL
ncbi:hypothetical protein FOA43_003893 [Brettanomyces nanus]|uniref:PH domain-containing protein n=1 Tax=Eeniella nana TaxID=13502 RepID=A0A875SCI9_EENNA|nr:uncharacterized protein FOA43_003893 [Brettanomyces nanus]QPG76504.1 hypothetical protein FOA43_003893 [Brettanomyces nanus]